MSDSPCILNVAAIALLLSIPVATPGADAEAAIQKAGRAKDSAMKARDGETLKKLLAENFRSAHSHGVRYDKASAITLYTGDTYRYESIQRSEAEVRVFGTTAIETGRQRIVARLNGRPERWDLLYTEVWILKDGHWRLASDHYCQSPK